MTKRPTILFYFFVFFKRTKERNKWTLLSALAVVEGLVTRNEPTTQTQRTSLRLAFSMPVSVSVPRCGLCKSGASTP